MNLTRLTFEFLVDEEVFRDSGPSDEYDDILLKPLRDAGYKVESVGGADKHTTFVYKITK